MWIPLLPRDQNGAQDGGEQDEGEPLEDHVEGCQKALPDFAEFDLITPNEREARFALGDQDTILRPLALTLFRQARCRNLILKLGERGLLAYRRPGDDPRDFFTLDSFADRVVDPVGAGDALLAYATLALVATRTLVVASILGSISAAIACERQGNLPVSPAEVEAKITDLERLANYV